MAAVESSAASGRRARVRRRSQRTSVGRLGTVWAEELYDEPEQPIRQRRIL